MSERLGPGILSGPIEDPRRRGQWRKIEAAPGMVVTDLGSRFTGVIVSTTDQGVRLRSRNSGLERVFALRSGSFLLGAETVTLVRPAGSVTAKKAPDLTPSGSVAVAGAKARVARAGRIMVEGVHDAELVEKVWGDDLRVDGIVVERLDGIDDLAHVVEAFAPDRSARLGVLVDHLVPGSKESRIVAGLGRPHLLVLGTPYVDVWQAIRPATLGIAAWPVIPRGRPWKEGICEAFGEPSPGRLWKRLLGQVNSYVDLEPTLVGAVEALIDFVTEPTG